MFCINCGKEVKIGDNFCFNCGKELNLKNVNESIDNNNKTISTMPIKPSLNNNKFPITGIMYDSIENLPYWAYRFYEINNVQDSIIYWYSWISPCNNRKTCTMLTDNRILTSYEPVNTPEESPGQFVNLRDVKDLTFNNDMNSFIPWRDIFSLKQYFAAKVFYSSEFILLYYSKMNDPFISEIKIKINYLKSMF